MSEDKGRNSDSQLDTVLAQRIAELRQSEAATAPPFKRPALAATPRAPEETPGQRLAFVLPRLAAAAAIVGVGFFLLRDTPQEDPAAIYAGIMEHQQMQTDWLLSVSDVVLPAQQSVPTLYDMEAALDANQDFE